MHRNVNKTSKVDGIWYLNAKLIYLVLGLAGNATSQRNTGSMEELDLNVQMRF